MSIGGNGYILRNKRKRNNGLDFSTSSIINPSLLKASTKNSFKGLDSEYWNTKLTKTDTAQEEASYFLKLFPVFASSMAKRVVLFIRAHFNSQPETEESPIKKHKADTSKTVAAESKHTKSHLPKKLLENKFVPEIKDDYSGVNFVESPIDWDFKSLIDTSKEVTSNDYGRAFIRTEKKYKRSSIEGQYLRSVYEGQYMPPPTSNNSPPNSRDPNEKGNNLVRGIQKLTENLSKDFANKVKVNDDDVIIWKEVRLPPATPSKFSLKFDTDFFENEYRYYQKILFERKEIQEKVHKAKLESEVAKPEFITPLSKSEEDEILNIWKSNDKDSKILVTAFNIDVKVSDLKTLADKHWLNDTVIEVYLKTLITEKVYAFNSFFFTTMETRGYQGVQKWMKRAKVSIKDLEKIIVPINVHQTHWVLGVIDLKGKKLLYLDSLATHETPHAQRSLKLLHEYVNGESKKQGVPEISEGFKSEQITTCPQQKNGFDCGVFTLLNALCSSQNRTYDYQSSDAKLFRRVVAHTILRHSDK